MGRGDLGGVAWSRGIPAKKCGGGSVSRGGRRGKNSRRKGAGRFYRSALLRRREGERSGHGIGLKTAGGAGGSLECVAAALLRRPDVARRGEDSGGSAGGGRSGRTTRGRGERRRTAQRWPAWKRRRGALHRRQGAHRQAAGGVARASGSQREAGERRGKWGGGTWLGSGQRRGGRAAHMAGQRRRRAAEEKQRRGRER
ncbi:hypothetical protein GQ55_7G078700 [Panicum hallii var. hallii]|uniref:Uncharacterized protein n=1 Tax=Panicum hallii var. hallii TaxID=1504633 RepID=A0A2T7CSW0_9POAL|nr:hypothetical protein GQ55_7G078700 [Panicum hallii var. hallii]